MAQFYGAKLTHYHTYEILVRPADVGLGGEGDVRLPDDTIMPWRSLGGYVWVHVGAHRTGTIRERDQPDAPYQILGVDG